MDLRIIKTPEAPFIKTQLF